MNPDIATAKPAILSALRKANNVIGIGDLHGWPRPQGYVDAQAMLNACREVERLNPTPPAAPTKPKDIAKWVDATVELRHQEATRRDVVDELVLSWERETAIAGLAAAADYNARLVTAFDELVAQFDEHASAARELNGHETPGEIDAHTAALRAASELSNALLERSVIADAAQEAADIGPDVIWLILEPTPATTGNQVQEALATFRERFPQSLAEWDSLRPLGLRLAPLGEVAARRQRHSDFMWRVGHETPDLGQRDHSYGEIEGNPAGHYYGLQAQADTDRIFDSSPSMSMEAPQHV